jgi:hypothetical protein
MGEDATGEPEVSRAKEIAALLAEHHLARSGSIQKAAGIRQELESFYAPVGEAMATVEKSAQKLVKQQRRIADQQVADAAFAKQLLDRENMLLDRAERLFKA